MSSRKERRKRRAEAAASAMATTTVETLAPGPESLAPAALDVPILDVPITERSPEVDAAFDDARWTPEAFARRARLAKYVGASVAACAVLLAVAGGVRYSRHAAADADALRAANAGTNAIAIPAAAPAPAPPPPPAPEATATEPTDPEPVVATEEPAAPAPSATDRELARQAKREAHFALEIGHVAESIVTGERSVALDPTDREAWLVLGAAYLQRGAHDDARRCFQSCLKEGTRGEMWQCAAMLR